MKVKFLIIFLMLFIGNTIKSINKKADIHNCKIQIQERNIVLICHDQKTIYKDLIIDEMSISTDFLKDKNNEFSLVYELNGSATKVKEKYNFIYSNQGIFLIYKEVVKFGKEGIMSNRAYFEPIDMKGKNYENIQSLGDQLEETFSQNNATINYFDTNNKIFAKNSLNKTNEDIFINYPDLSQSKITITDVESANNLAFLLEQKDANNESKFLLQHIISQYPERVVAYLNLADAEWKLNHKDEAKKNYTFYLSIMKKQKKNLTKIPQRVYERIK